MTVRPFDFQATARPPQPSRSPPWVPSGPPPSRRQDLTDLHPGAALSWPENHVFRRRFLRSHPNFQLKFSFVSPPNRSSTRSPTGHRRELQEVVEVHRIHHRATHSLRASKSGRVKSFGIGKNTGETLPNFRQKSKGILKGS
ncbi:hypothetical protein Prudu_145S000300 [Prunus dulcis]|uniref:Uncharacterized protein n=1 Tax=Prunus dulcis TaxID=3755 RepID=A0A5H2XKG2_PRUDU|nr:hypothetical protein Prudu_145S000300 [Prunus dulcis]